MDLHRDDRREAGRGVVVVGDTAAALLAAGRALFAERGYGGASVRDITSLAGANLGAITYHFGSKRNFYEQVIAESLQPLVQRVEYFVSGKERALDRLEGVVRAYYEHLWSHPELPRLVVRELSEGGAPPSAAFGPIRRLYQAMATLIIDGQAKGEIRDADPLVLVVSIIALPIHYGLVGPALVEIFGQDPSDPAHRAAVVHSAVTFVRRGLMAQGTVRS